MAKALAWLTGRRLMLLALAGAAGVLATAGRSELARKERELVFRIEHANHNNSMHLGSADYGKALRELFGFGKRAKAAI